MPSIADTLKDLSIAIGGGGALEIVHNTPVNNERDALYKLIFQGILFLMALIPLADRVINYYINKHKNKR
jgi:hypothetical protein